MFFYIDLKIPINYLLSKSFNERDLLQQQMEYVNNNDVINKILDKKSNFIFRVGKNNKFIKNINENKSSAIFNYNYKNVI